MKKVFYILLIFCSLFCISCKTTTVKGVKYKDSKPLMYGMIYDFDNKPVEAASIYVDDKFIIKTDVQGRFILSLSIKNKKDESLIRIEKDGYETINGKFVYDPINVLYFRMINAQQLLTLSEEYVQNNELDEALIHLDRALKLSPLRSDILFLKSITLYKQKKIDECLLILENLKSENMNNIYIKQFYDKVIQEKKI